MARFSVLGAAIAVLLSTVAAIRVIESTSLNLCMDNSGLKATFFRVVFTPDNRTLTFRIDGGSEISDRVLLDLEVSGYGWNVFDKVIDPCDGGDSALKGLCPMKVGDLPNVWSNAQIPGDALKQVPGKFWKQESCVGVRF
jgi:hypothetical protein